MPLASVKAEDDDRVNVEPSAVAGISAFLGKLWKMVEDQKTDHLISWGKTGNTFVIKNQIDFARTILPNYYKHNNIASFIRQLNMYGFHKIISTTSGSLDSSDNDEIEFTHPCFVRGHPYLLEQIKRKMNNPKENCIKTDTGNQFNESIKRVFSDIKNLKGKQEHLGSQLCAVKQENEILWRELSLLRQKHAAQQNVLNKLIRFLVSLAQPSTNHNLVKRRLVPLMLKDAASNSKSKISSYYEGDHVYTVKKREGSSPGPTIHEIHPSEISDNETPVSEDSNSPIMIEQEIVTSPASSVANSDTSAPSPEPVPAALLMPSKKGKPAIQTMYVTPSPQLKSHFLLSPGSHKSGDSPEYLVPDKTDNPLLELVHEAEPDEDGEYITIVTGDGGGDVGSPVPASLIAEAQLESALGSRAAGKKKTAATAAPRRRPRREAIPTSVLPKIAAVRSVERKKRPNQCKDDDTTAAENVLGSNEFLFDIDLNNCSEPMISIPAPSSRLAAENSEAFTLDRLAENRANIPITVDDMISVSPEMPKSTMPDSPVKVPSPPTLTMPATVYDVVHSPLRTPSSVFNVPDCHNSFMQQAHSPSSNPDKSMRSDDLIKDINECIDNAQNMKIACSDPTAANNRYVDDISMQLDTMQTDIDSLKELIQNEGLSLDTNTFFDMLNQEHVNYDGSQDVHPNYHRPEEGKVEGHELISNQPMFDLDEFLTQNDWSQPVGSMHAADSDYCQLNTPQIERPLEEIQSMFPPPSKKIRS